MKGKIISFYAYLNPGPIAINWITESVSLEELDGKTWTVTTYRDEYTGDRVTIYRLAETIIESNDGIVEI